jgi:hypothetical protein
MTYFPNGTSLECYIETVCDHCIHFVDLDDGRGFGCPVLDAHFALNSMQLDHMEAKTALEALIPTYPAHNGFNVLPGQCKMFILDPDHQDQEGAQ